ncbi:MAG: hypothetical protein V4644_01810 [Patescibacteria group bacterium]
MPAKKRKSSVWIIVVLIIALAALWYFVPRPADADAPAASVAQQASVAGALRHFS